MATPRQIGLVGCVKQKQHVTAPAAELYTSPLFVGRRRRVEATCDQWWILSAVHGLVHPATVLAPYDESLIAANTATRRAWAEATLRQILELIRPEAGDIFELHAGVDYLDFGLAAGIAALGCQIERPTAGMGIGRQLAYYAA